MSSKFPNIEFHTQQYPKCEILPTFHITPPALIASYICI